MKSKKKDSKNIPFYKRAIYKLPQESIITLFFYKILELLIQKNL